MSQQVGDYDDSQSRRSSELLTLLKTPDQIQATPLKPFLFSLFPLFLHFSRQIWLLLTFPFLSLLLWHLLCRIEHLLILLCLYF